MSAAISALTDGRPFGADKSTSGVTRRRCQRRTVPGGDEPVHGQLCWQEPDDCGEDSAAGPVEPGPGIGATQHGDLVPQPEQLRVFGGR